MSTEIGDIIFDTKSTLFQVLDTLDVPSIAAQLASTNDRLDDVNDQLRQLGAIVDANYIASNTSFIAINTQLDTLEADVLSLATEIAPLSSQVDSLSTQVTSLSGQVSTLTTTVNSYNIRILALESTTTSLSSSVASINSSINTINSSLNALGTRVGVLETNRVRQQLLTLGSEYFFTYRTGGVPGNTYYYRVNYSGSQSTVIRAGIGHSATVYDQQAGTTQVRTVYLAAPFDMFSVNGRYNYQMAQGPCVLSFTQNNTSPTLGYIITTQ